jgi:hypothetical protein
MRHLITHIVLLFLVLGMITHAQEPPLTFTPHPRLEFTPAEIAAWKADPARQGEITQRIAAADAILVRGLTVPEKSGQWIFYYACPKDGARLRPETPERHVCPVCKAVYTDERTQAAYRTQQNDGLNDEMHALSVAYALTHDAKYAQPVIDALLKIMRLYPTWERHDRWGRTGVLAVVGGRRYSQHLDEAYSHIILAKTYDLIADAVPADARAIIEKQLTANMREIQGLQSFVGAKNNHQTWFNAAYASVGVAIGDETLVRDSTYGKSGLLWQLQESVTDDGLWYEGTLAYQRYAMQAVVENVDAIKRVGWNLTGNARLKSLWTAPLQLAYPNGQLPVFHDSDPASLDSWRDMYRWGYGYFKDPLFAEYAGLATAEKATPKSADLSGIGIAILRGTSPAGPVCAMMDYGIHGDHHGHPDKLNIVIYGQGQEWALDPGRITYSVPEYETWCRTTLAHNTVTIDGKNQQPDTGTLLYFDANDHYTAALAMSKGAYPGVTLKRFLVLCDGLLVDVFAVQGNRDMQIDWALHARGAITTDLLLQERAAPLGTTGGYQHLAKLREGKAAQWSSFTFAPTAEKRFRAYGLDNNETTIVTGEGIGYNLNDRVPCLLRRRTAKSTIFVTVYDLTGTDRTLSYQHLIPLAHMSNDEEIDFAVTVSKDTSYTFSLDLGEKPIGIDHNAKVRCIVTTPTYHDRNAEINKAKKRYDEQQHKKP